MIRLAADEDFNNLIVRGVRRRLPEIDFVRVQDCGLRSEPDGAVLDWAAAEDRILVTHDAVATTPNGRTASSTLRLGGECVAKVGGR